MKPLEEEHLCELDRLRKENELQSTRRNEIREFWKSGCKMAELNVSGTVTMDHEIQLYKKAVRQLYRELGLDSFTDITLHKRQGKLIAVRGRK